MDTGFLPWPFSAFSGLFQMFQQVMRIGSKQFFLAPKSVGGLKIEKGGTVFLAESGGEQRRKLGKEFSRHPAVTVGGFGGPAVFPVHIDAHAFVDGFVLQGKVVIIFVVFVEKFSVPLKKGTVNVACGL